MRIGGSSRPQSLGFRTVSAQVSGGDGFAVADEPARTSSAESPTLVAGLMDINTLMALQSVDDALHARRKAVRRGAGLLDALDEVKADLLVGRVSEGRLNQMLSIIGQARQRTMPGLDAVLDDIELRARVELAKFGRYAAA